MPTYQRVMALRNKAILEHYPKCKWVTESCCYDLSLSLGRCFQINSGLPGGLTQAGYPEIAEVLSDGPITFARKWQTPKWSTDLWRANSLILQGSPCILIRHMVSHGEVFSWVFRFLMRKPGHLASCDKESPGRELLPGRSRYAELVKQGPPTK